jgi:CHAT domain-containing protein
MAALKKFDPELGQSLYKNLLSRVLTDVPKGAPLVIIPDGVLAVLPFEALVIGGKANWKEGAKGAYTEGLTFLGYVYPVSYYQSINSLTLVRGVKRKAGKRMLVIADPVFHMQDVRAQGAKETRLASEQGRAFPVLMASIEGASEGGFKFSRLAKTKALGEGLQKLYGNQMELCADLKANKEYFLKTIGPRLSQYGSIVFATHGLFSTKIPGIREPFLALTMVPPGTDGFLTMSDVMSLKMNADVVALTACQTGLGKDLSGEGVMSMGRAFQYAGARSVLMSLWSVAEDSSVILTESFFRNIKEGKSKLESLKLARDEIRKAGYDHPFFWASFVLVGEVD